MKLRSAQALFFFHIIMHTNRCPCSFNLTSCKTFNVNTENSTFSFHLTIQHHNDDCSFVILSFIYFYCFKSIYIHHSAKISLTDEKMCFSHNIITLFQPLSWICPLKMYKDVSNHIFICGLYHDHSNNWVLEFMLASYLVESYLLPAKVCLNFFSDPKRHKRCLFLHLSASYQSLELSCLQA